MTFSRAIMPRMTNMPVALVDQLKIHWLKRRTNFFLNYAKNAQDPPPLNHKTILLESLKIRYHIDIKLLTLRTMTCPKYF